MMNGMRVLVADDELIARKRLLRLLGAMDGIAPVGECATGAAVLERLKIKDVDVVLLDIHMPGLSGIETLALLPDDGPLVVYVRDARTGEMDIFAGTTRTRLVDPALAARLARASR